ncbi:MAG: VWA domain-containing protein, partial [Leptotrichiaceae bacterium]|nr:VWA domain-containing protein [Leptotrichiaceae bacterium]
MKLKKNKNLKFIWLLLLFTVLVSCFGKKEEQSENIKNNDEKTEKNLSEEELQAGKGVNSDLPDIVYTYEGIVDAPAGIYQIPSVYEEKYIEKMELWKENIRNEMKKIKPSLSEEASDQEIERMFKQFLYIIGYDYTPFETIDRFSYVIFKNDMENPFTHKKIEENMNVNVEIVLDASGSMIKKIGNKTMMEIAKESIQRVLSQMPENAKVGLRVFGHKGDNSYDKKEESCNANELISPIETLNLPKIENALTS